jgi:type VI secretion system protein ImpJ
MAGSLPGGPQMMSAEKIPQAVCWQEGMRLAPQHFQQQFLRQERLATLLAQSAEPCYWGVLQLETQIGGTVFELLALEALMPDGLLLRWLAGDGSAPLRLNLAEQQADDAGRYTVSLAIKSHEGAMLHGGMGRFRRLPGVEARDHNNGDNPLTLTTLQPLLQLVCGRPPGYEAFDLLPLAHYGLRDGAYTSDGYVPPGPVLAPASPLRRDAQAVCAKLRDKYAHFSDQYIACMRAGERSKAAAIQWKLSLLGGQLLELDALLMLPAPHPQALYLALCRLLGGLSAIDPAAGYPCLEPFDYLDLRRGMNALLAQIETRLVQFAPGFERLSFRQDGHKTFELALAGLAPAERYYIGLRSPIGGSAQDMLRWVEAAIIASAGRIAPLDHNRVGGMARRVLEHAQAARFEVNTDIAVFELSGEANAYFDPAGVLQIVGPAPGAQGQLAPREIMLFQKLPDATPATRD